MKSLFILLIIFGPCLKITAQADAAKTSIKREDTNTIKIIRLSVNTEYSDFSPFYLNDELLFVSGRYHSNGIVYSPDAGEITDIYKAAKTDSVHFKKVENVGSPINTRVNEGPFTMDKTGKTIYFTANDKNNTLKIFTSKKKDDKWAQPEILSICTGTYSYCHPSLSPDESLLFFSSDKPGGWGGMDVYFSKLTPNGWSKPINAGRKINSPKNEVFPFAGSKNQLYFSSNQESGFGGLDIYSIELRDTAKGIVKHFGTPLNSRFDDFGVWIDSTLEKGYFSSDRVSKNKDDIYFFYTWIPDFSDSKKPAVKNSFCYTFFEESTLEGNDTTILSHEWNFGDGHKSRSLKAKHCYNKPGNYLVELNIIQKVSGEIFRSEASYSLTVEPPKQLVINCRDTLAAGKETFISSEKSELKDYDIHRTYWNFGDGRYNDGNFVKHNYKKPGSYTIQMYIIAKHQKTAKVEKFKTEKKIIVTDNSIYAKK